MVSDEEALRLDRAEKKRRRFRTLRTIAVVVLLLAAAVGAMALWTASWHATYDGPWCVWATPVGAPTITGPAPPGTVAAPTFGDVRVAPGGDAAPGTWAGSYVFASPATPVSKQTPMLYDFAHASGGALFGGTQWIPTYYASAVQRTAADGKVWTAFLLESLPPGASLAAAPDARCAGTWEITDDEGTHPATVRLDLLATGAVRNAADGSAWAVRGGALLIRNGGEIDPVWLYVGVLSDDLQTMIGLRESVTPIHGARIK